MSQFATKIVQENGQQFVRLLFPHADQQASYASNVLIEFVLSLVDDDRIAPHGMDSGCNYIDIPTAAFDTALLEIAA